MKNLLMILLCAFTMTMVSCQKEKLFREDHRFYWGEEETCFYQDKNGTKVYVDKKYCSCNNMSSQKITEPPPTSPGFESECIMFTIEGQPAFIDLNGWPCYQVYIPSGLDVDSFFCDIERPGYPSSEFDLYAYCCLGSTYNQATAIICSPNYQTTDTPMYGEWVYTEFHSLGEEKVVQISAPPTSYGTIFHSVTVACHKYIGIPAPHE